MNEIIKLNQDSEKITLSARELHQFLEIKTLFKDWFPRMCDYGFEENKDFNPLKFEQVRIEGNREVKREIDDAQITLDMAKEICMITRNDKGKQARRYFIEVEKDWNSPDRVMERALKIAHERVESLSLENKMQQQQIAELKPKADYTDIILKSDSLVAISQIANDYGRSGAAFNKLLHELGVIYKQCDQWLLYAKYQSNGYTSSETINYTDSHGRMHTKLNTKWTQKGRLFLYELLKKNGVLPSIETIGA